jgi:hypothetical protein
MSPLDDFRAKLNLPPQIVRKGGIVASIPPGSRKAVFYEVIWLEFAKKTSNIDSRSVGGKEEFPLVWAGQSVEKSKFCFRSHVCRVGRRGHGK